MSVAVLAGNQGISLPYLEQLVAALKKNGCVHAVRGVQGGYILSKPPAEITVGEVLRILEGKTDLVDCVGQDFSAECENACTCSARPLWLKLQSKINSVLNETTILDLAEDHIEQKKRRTNDANLLG